MLIVDLASSTLIVDLALKKEIFEICYLPYKFFYTISHSPAYPIILKKKSLKKGFKLGCQPVFTPSFFFLILIENIHYTSKSNKVTVLHQVGVKSTQVNRETSTNKG